MNKPCLICAFLFHVLSFSEVALENIWCFMFYIFLISFLHFFLLCPIISLILFLHQSVAVRCEYRRGATRKPKADSAIYHAQDGRHRGKALVFNSQG